MPDPTFLFRPYVVPLEPAPEPRLAARVLGSRDGFVWLDSAGGSPRRMSVMAFDPLAVVEPDGGERSLAWLRAFAGRLRPHADAAEVPGPFQGGFIGALSYDLGIAGEALELPRDAWGQPLVVGGLYCDFVTFDHERDRAWLVLGEAPGDGRASTSRRAGELCERLAAAVEERATARSGQVAPPTSAPRLTRHTSAAEHRDRIDRLRAAIGRGELYQANLAHRFSASTSESPLELYLRLRSVNAAPFGGYLEWTFGPERGAILSASPELLVEVLGGRARTRPIKGTRPRGRTVEEDRRLSEELLASDKDLAELTMIVDLERNDLGRIARVGSVRVGQLPTLESYAAVHHLVADVECELRADCDAFDVLAALFPGGSITGAPKIASMREIAALEREGRGFFTGSMGFVDTRGAALWNILIRTLVWRADGDAGEVSFHVGGGITWASDPHAEERETLDKGTALAATLSDEVAEAFGPLAPLWSDDRPVAPGSGSFEGGTP